MEQRILAERRFQQSDRGNRRRLAGALIEMRMQRSLPVDGGALKVESGRVESGKVEN